MRKWWNRSGDRHATSAAIDDAWCVMRLECLNSADLGHLAALLLDQAMPGASTPGETYLASRGIPIDIATAAGVRYIERWGHWTRDEGGDWQLEGTSRRVVFPIVDKVGELIGIQGRKIAAGEHGEKMLSASRLSRRRSTR